MSLEQMYQNRRDQIIARRLDALIRPNAEPNQIVADGQVQVSVAKKDVARLVENGMESTLVVAVEEALGAYTWLISLVSTKLSDQRVNMEQLEEAVTQGYSLRRNLFKFGKFGCKKNKLNPQLAELKEIIEGFGDLDMILDLLKLYQLFTNNPEIVEGLPLFEQGWIFEAKTLHQSIYDLRNEVKDPTVQSEIEVLETEVKQAYDLYQEKLTELRDWGEFVFDGEERVEKYQSEYMQRRGEKAAATRREQAEATKEAEALTGE